MTVFAGLLAVASAAQPVTHQEHANARRWMAEAEATTNPVRLLVLAMDIRKALDKALAAEPNNVEVRLDLLRFHAVTPRIAGGDMAEARRQAAEIARLDPPSGHFARGYLAYREKELATARKELREAVAKISSPATKALAAKWLGWLSQETQQWTEAFAMFESIRAADATGLYEIGRTAAFCRCELERGKAALEEYIRLKPKKGMPTVEQAKYQLKQLR